MQVFFRKIIIASFSKLNFFKSLYVTDRKSYRKETEKYHETLPDFFVNIKKSSILKQLQEKRLGIQLFNQRLFIPEVSKWTMRSWLHLTFINTK